MRRQHLASLTLLTLAVAAGCSPGLDVKSYEAPPLSVGSRELVLTDALGARADVGLALDVAFEELGSDGWFNAYDDSGAGMLLVGERGPRLTGDGVLEPGRAYLRLDVVEAGALLEVTESESVDEAGNVTITQAERTQARFVVVATIATAGGAVRELETEGVAEQEGPASEIELLEAAAREAVRRVLDEITPDETSTRVPLDDRDAAQKAIVERAMNRQVGAAIDEELHVIATAPTAAAYYNFGVMLEHMGEQESALNAYASARESEGCDAPLARMIDEAERGAQGRLAVQAELE